MAAPQGFVRYHQDEQLLRFQIEGWATMQQSLPFRRFVEQNLGGKATKIWVDLRHCTYIDSTFLGTLLFLQRAVVRRVEGEFRLICLSPQCTNLFQQMGVQDIFQIISTEESAEIPWVPLTKEPDDGQRLQRNVLEAHEELAGLPGSAGEPFRAVARCLKKEMDTK